MDRANPETLVFVLPGLLHQFGNLLLLIQGTAQTVTPATLVSAQKAVLGATTRGSNSLHLLRYLLGDPVAPAGDPHELLEQLAELVRVPMRENNQLLELRLPRERSPGSVDAGHFVVLVVEALRNLVDIVPPGVRGMVLLELSRSGAATTQVRLRFEPSAGELPFPLAAGEVQRALSQRAAELRAATACRVHGRGIELEFQTGGVSRVAEA